LGLFINRVEHSGKIDMRAVENVIVDKSILQELVPLNALSTERFREALEKNCFH